VAPICSPRRLARRLTNFIVTNTISLGSTDLIGGTGTTATSTDLKIIPYALGSSGASGETGVGDTFLSYGQITGFTTQMHPLAAANYLTDINTAGATSNFSLTGTNGVASSAVTIDALRLDASTAGVTLGSGTAASALAITSGAILRVPAARTTMRRSAMRISPRSWQVERPNEFVISTTSSNATPPDRFSR